jgi:hypothetical protein
MNELIINIINYNLILKEKGFLAKEQRFRFRTKGIARRGVGGRGEGMVGRG